MTQIKASIDFDKGKWGIKVNKTSADYVDNSDGVDITLSIGDYQASENVVLESKNKYYDKLMYKRKPKLYCGDYKNKKHDESEDDDGEEDDDDNDEMEDEEDHKSKKYKDTKKYRYNK